MLPVVKPNTAVGMWANEVNKSLHTNTINNNLGSYHDRSSTGATVRPRTLTKLDVTERKMPVPYDELEFYTIGDEVYLDTDRLVAFFDPETQDFSSTYQVYAGLWLCVKTVPTARFQDSLTVATDELKSFGTQYWRENNVNYYPQFPHPTNVNDRYWLLLSFYPKTMKACVDGVTHTYYVQSAESGSAQV